jgi:sugar lactone lactonase YvrE
MLKRFLFLFILLLSFSINAQDFSNLWKGYFSYFNVVDVTRGNDKIYAASENAIFSYDVNTNEIETVTTIEGLSGEFISTIEYSVDFQLLIIGYETGLMEIYFESNNEILTVVDIIEKESISPSLKRINHFNEHEGLIYIATDYGISIYDLDRLEFGDTYFLGNGGSQITVEQTTVFNGFIYAACTNANGLKKGVLDNPNLIDFQQWETIIGGNFTSIETVEDRLYTIRLDKTFNELVNDNLVQISIFNILPLDTTVADDKLIVTLKNNVFVYNSNADLLTAISGIEEFDTDYTSATVFNDDIYIGTEEFGVLKTNVNSLTEFAEIRPQGPLRNNAFKLEALNDELWVSFGDYDAVYFPNPFRRYGISHLIEDEWNNIPYDSVLGARNLNYIAVNPFNTSQVFISAFHEGILEVNNEVPTILHDQTNSGLESLVVPGAPNIISIRQTGSKFDRSGILWTLTNRTDRPLVSYDPSSQTWQNFSFEDIIEDGLFDEIGFSDLDIDDNGNIWVGAFVNGLIGYSNEGVINKVNRIDQNMPSNKVRSLAVDNRNQIWIGTDFGLRVLFNTTGFFDDPNPSVNEIVILEDGIPKELLDDQFITDIKVDGSNNKWVGTLDSGIFYFSPDGQETIFHFTTDNSPLPSNQINDISIDSNNGIVYIATQKGLVSFTSGGSKPEDELGNVFVYPNPVRPEYDILGSDNLNDINKGIKIKGLTENVNIKITDIEGNLVAEAQSRVNLRSSSVKYNFAIDGGTAIWNGKNLANNIVATGVYLVMISDLDSFETKVLKVLIVR